MKSGYVCITGKPNVGKSTFLNALIGHKVAITSPKPQTTRNQIKALYKDENHRIAFIDTPGYHEPNNRLDLFLNSQIKDSYKICDVVLLFIDLTRPIDKEDEAVINTLKEFKIKNIVLVLTKSDMSSSRVVNEYKENISKFITYIHCIALSAKKNKTFSELLSIVDIYLDGEDKILTLTDSDNFTISEIIREQVIFNTKQELPYATGVYVELNNYDDRTKMMNIAAVIVVEKESQKPIIIGKGGSMIKKIGTLARKELLTIFDCKINLKLFVKVEKEWRNNEKFLNTIGYSKK